MYFAYKPVLEALKLVKTCVLTEHRLLTTIPWFETDMKLKPNNKCLKTNNLIQHREVQGRLIECGVCRSLNIQSLHYIQ